MPITLVEGATYCGSHPGSNHVSYRVIVKIIGDGYVEWAPVGDCGKSSKHRIMQVGSFISWVKAQMPKEAGALDLMRKLTDEQRLSVMNQFCKHCGGDDPRCQCWNDE